MDSSSSPLPDGASAARVDGATWKSIARRLYALVLGSVAVAFVLAIASAQLLAPPPRPWLIRSAALQIERALDDPRLLAEELKRFADNTGDEIAVYDDAKRLVAASSEPAPPLPANADVEALRESPPPPPDFDLGMGFGAGPPRLGSPAMPPDGAMPPGKGLRSGPGPAGAFAERPNGPGFPMPPGDMQTLVMPMTSPSGARFAAVIQRPGAWPAFTLLATSLLLALAAIAVLVARVLSRPLSELERAADAFGRGDLDTRVDVKKAGAFGTLARAFNEMATRVVDTRRAERNLLANVSHELRTPLSRIRVAVELADESDAETVRASLTDIGKDLAEVETMMQDIFTAARLESGVTLRTTLRAEPDSLEPLLAAAAQRFRAAYPNHTLRCDTAAAADTMIVHDKTLLRRAVENLLDNAGKYSNKGTVVELDCAAENGAVVITVRDTGVGISTDDQAHLFTPFFRADKSRTRASGGVGLGLVLVKRIVEAHGGKISVVSVPGSGTTVTLRLPRQ